MKNIIIKYSFLLFSVTVLLVGCSKQNLTDVNSLSSEVLSGDNSNLIFENPNSESTSFAETTSNTSDTFLSEDNTDQAFNESHFMIFKTVNKAPLKVTSENEIEIKNMIFSYPLIKKGFDDEKEYTIVIDGNEYYYDSKTGMLGNNGVKILEGKTKEKMDNIILG